MTRFSCVVQTANSPHLSRHTPSFWKVTHSLTTSEMLPVPFSPPTIFFECYVRTSDGRITLFTGPRGFDCEVSGIVNGTVTGDYGAPSGYYAGYLRAPVG